MRCKIPEISWHNRDPVLSVDIQLRGVNLPPPTLARLASGGTDAHVLIWYVNRAVDSECIELDLAADLARHQRAVNTVRWSPDGKLLASGDDESVVLIWKQKEDHEVINIVDADGCNEQDKELWITMKVLRGHREDIYDLSWSPNSQFLVTGSVDNTAMLWDVHRGKSFAILDDHKGYVQGVAWDPCNQYIATMSTDRHLRIFDVNTKRVVSRLSKSILPVGEGHEYYEKNVRLFHDGTLQTFFRRLCFSPDGKLLLTPSGITDYDGVIKPTNTTYGFTRYNLNLPAFVLPFQNDYTVAVRCSPVLYRLRPHDAKDPPAIMLPYRMIYAVATKSSVFIFDTQQHVPFAVVSNIHYTRLTDLTWSGDGCVLIVSSTDGFCSLITFGADELGERYEEMDAVLSAASCTSENAPSLIKKAKKHRTASADEIVPQKPLAERKKHDTFANENAHSVDMVSDESSSTADSECSSSTIPSSPVSVVKAKPMPTPIEIRRSPRKVAETRSEPTPIAIRRTPRKVVQSTPPNRSVKSIAIRHKSSANDEGEQIKAQEPILEIVLTKEIISSGERFESPEKKCTPVTPIQVRRQPRTPNSNSQTPKCQSQKPATPIAVRRTPRALISTTINSPVPVEEAMDAWPLEGISPLTTGMTPIKKKPEVTALSTPQLVLNDVTAERTEDIRLVYEDTEESTPATLMKVTPSKPTASVIT